MNTILGSIKSHIVCMNAFCYNGMTRASKQTEKSKTIWKSDKRMSESSTKHLNEIKHIWLQKLDGKCVLSEAMNVKKNHVTRENFYHWPLHARRYVYPINGRTANANIFDWNHVNDPSRAKFQKP